MYGPESNAAAASQFAGAYNPNVAQLQAQPEQPLGQSIENITMAAHRLECVQRLLEDRLIGARPELANGAGAEPVMRPLARDASQAAARLNRVADLLEKLHQQL